MLKITVYCLKRWPSALLLVLGVLVWSVAIYSIIVFFVFLLKFKNTEKLYLIILWTVEGMLI